MSHRVGGERLAPFPNGAGTKPRPARVVTPGGAAGFTRTRRRREGECSGRSKESCCGLLSQVVDRKDRVSADVAALAYHPVVLQKTWRFTGKPVGSRCRAVGELVTRLMVLTLLSALGGAESVDVFGEPVRLGAKVFDCPTDRGCYGDRNEVLTELASRAPTSVRLEPPVQTPALRDGRPGIGLSRNHHVGNPRLVCFDVGLA